MATLPTVRIRIDADTELRTLEERDAPYIFALTDANRVYLRQWLPWVDSTRSVEDSYAFISTMNIQRINNGSFGCVILYKRQVAGTISFHLVDWSNRRVEIGYWLGAAFQGNGLMTKACKAMVAYAFDEWQLNKVEIRCATSNTKSCAIPHRLGFTLEGIIRQAEWLYDHFVDLKVYGMLESEWRL
jgi:ribosomal-protein-serine acetyltransferase